QQQQMGGNNMSLCPHGSADVRAGDMWGNEWTFAVFADDAQKRNVDKDLYVRSNFPVKVGKSTHVALVFDGRQFRLFVDGIVAAKKDVEGLTIRPHSAFQLGNSGGLHGLMTEVRVSNVARYEKNFTPQKRFEADQDTVALYHMEEGSGDVLTDS